MAVGEVQDLTREYLFEWRINEFFSLLSEESYYSRKFVIDGEYWYLSVYPNGTPADKSVGYISVYLYRNSSGPSKRMTWSFGLKRVDGIEDYVQLCSDVFTGAFGSGCPKFLQRSELREKRFLLTKSGILTIICRIEFCSKSTYDTGHTVDCSYCGTYFDEMYLSAHERKCLDKPIECPTCSDVVDLRDWFAHECPMMRVKGHTVYCSYCGIYFDEMYLSAHERKCLDKPIECPTCSDVVDLRDWFAHECPMMRVKESSKKEPKEESKSSASICKESPKEEPKEESQISASICKGCDSTLRKSVPLPGSKTLQDFKEFFLRQEECDTTLNVKGKEFLAHRNILMARSSVFASAFRNDMKEKATGIINIDDCDPASFSDFLCFIYCGSVEKLTEDNVFSLFAAADKYDVQDLRLECMEFLKTNLSVDTFCDTIALALRYSEKALIELSTEFFTKNLQEIIVTVKWQSFSAENPTTSNELFIKALVPNKK